MPKTKDAVTMLKEDHIVVKDLFDEFEDAEGLKEKASIARKAIKELKIHDALEETLFYPKVRGAIGEEEVMNEAEEEHHHVRIAIAELDKLDDEDPMFEAKFTVLAEMVRHHIKEEESEMLPKAKKADIDLIALGEEMQQRKQELKSQGVPETKEMEMVSR